MKGIATEGLHLESQTANPNHQFTISWKLRNISLTLAIDTDW